MTGRNRASAKKAGTSWETAIVRALIDAGWPHAERRRLSGVNDRGDIAGIPGVVIEAKNAARLDLAGAVDEAKVEAANVDKALGPAADLAPTLPLAWIKRKGRSSALDGYVVMDGDTALRLLREAGY